MELREESLRVPTIDGQGGTGAGQPVLEATPDESPLASLIEQLRQEPRLGSAIRHTLYLPGAEPVFSEPSPPLPSAIARAVAAQGADSLWSHQVEGLEAVRSGANVLVTTPTASGKSLVFQLPILELASRGDTGRALFLYPLKALGQDQKARFDALAAAAGIRAPCEIYDGDTPKGQRAALRRKPPRVLISNPDMVHLGMLPYWSSWKPFLSELRWIVLDELHTYRGIFGCHFHHVLQRLSRICRRLGSDPRIIASSATAANAEEFAGRLTSREFHWVGNSTAPREARHLLLLQPEASPYTLTLQLLIRLLRAGQRTIVFTKARRIAELLFKWLQAQEPDLAARVASYRAGFLSDERRRIEVDLFSGRLLGVISTSALELGIDVGGLDACILVGYPGSMIATWQRSGRAGRRGRESLTALIALPDALDQYLLQRPMDLVQRPLEQLIVDPQNPLVGGSHLVCAAAEVRLEADADRRYVEDHRADIESLVEKGELAPSGDGRAWTTARSFPQRGVNLRGGGASHSIIDQQEGRVIGTIDGIRTLRECHPGAIYLHAGRQYLVHELREADKRVLVESVDVDYYTSALGEKQTRIQEVLAEKHTGWLSAWLGRLEVTERVIGYERKRILGQERLDAHRLDLPPVRFETVGLWWAVKPPLEAAMIDAERHVLGALHASEHAAISLFPLLAICDRGDIGGISIAHHPQVGCGAVFIYDGHSGGAGIARRGFEELEDLLARVVELLSACDCGEGCPSCVQSPKCGNGNRPLDKEGAREYLDWLRGAVPLAEEPTEGWALDLEAESGTGGSGLRQEGRVDLLPPAVNKVNPPLPSAVSAAPHTVSPPTAVTGAVKERRRRQGRRSAYQRRGRDLHRLITGWRDTTLIVDIETLRSARQVGGWHRIHRMGVALAVVCHVEAGTFETYFEPQVPQLIDRLRQAELVVGFNTHGFDFRVLAGYAGVDIARVVPSLDLLQDVFEENGVRRGLQHFATETLGVGKQGSGLESLEWVRQGRLDLVEEYCQQDVAVTRDLYLFGRREGYIRGRSRKGESVELRVEW